jgi:glyoxylase-like metal-dependent hydrolase (beta-lactamase superfamily II)
VRVEMKLIARRDLLRSSAALVGSTAVVHAFPWLRAMESTAVVAATEQPPAATTAAADARRADMAKAPIVTASLDTGVTLLSGPGGNVVVLTGADGKVVVDSFVKPVWSSFKSILDGLGKSPVRFLIDTHWHFDHADNNGNFRSAGAEVLAHANTKKRLSETHEALGMRFEPVSANELPSQTFTSTHKLQANGETVELAYIPPAHTDTDVSIRFAKANVLHLGDVFFNGGYPFIDAGTGGNIAGMIAGATKALELSDAQTKIVPGHGPLADRAALARYRDMLETARDRVQKLKASGRTLAESIAAKPTADLDAAWGKGFVQPDFFVTLVFNTI